MLPQRRRKSSSACARIRTTSSSVAVADSRRFAALLIQGMRAEAAIPQLPTAVRLPLTVFT
jgi:hypothetical protein